MCVLSGLFYFESICPASVLTVYYMRAFGTPTKRQVSKRQVSKRSVKTSETSGLQNVSFTKRQVDKMSGLQKVRFSKRLVAKKQTYIYSVLVHVCRQSDGCVLFSIFEVFLSYITIMASNK
jgi:hypothetical protein